MRNLFPTLLFLFCIWNAAAQKSVNIALIYDQPADNQMENQFQQSIKEEMMLLLQHHYTLHFNEYYGDMNQGFSQQFTQAYAVNDIVICLGTVSSNQLISLATYPKPSIASIVLDARLQQLNKTTEGSSGIADFTYLESPFNMKRDLNLLYEIRPFEQLLVFSEKGTLADSTFIQQLFSGYLDGKDIRVSNVFYSDILNDEFTILNDKNTAAYALPYLGKNPEAISKVFSFLNKNKIPSAALFGEEYLKAGALIGYETAENLQKIPRRIALTVMKILEGQKAENLSVEMQTFGENLVLNMETARQIEIYPDFDLMAKATLLNLEKIQTDNKISLHDAIGQALKNNLDIRIAQADIPISKIDIDLAKADLFPQLEVSTNLNVLDELTTLSYQGAQGRANWLISGELSQIVFAEPLLANIAIQKMLQQTENQELVQKQLDVIIDVTNAYINILFAKSNLNIQQENVARNKENYNISKAKEAIGYIGASDINRWEAELANANIELNKAYTGLRQAKFQLNQLLNRPIDEPVEVTALSLENSMLLITDKRADFINNYGELDQFADFLVLYSKEHLPELSQVNIGIAVQERLQLSRERAMYLPTVGLSASANRTLGKIKVPEIFMETENKTSWNIGLGLSYPIFQGNNRRKLIEQSKLNILQLQDTKKNLENQLEFRIRANLENVGASFSAMELSQIAADASLKNYVIVKNAYAAGQANVTPLIDAQNNALISELKAINSVYTFILDFLTMERSVGFYNFLATPAQKENFFQQLNQFFDQN